MSARVFRETGPLMGGVSAPPPPPPPPGPSQLPLPEDAPPAFEEEVEEIDLSALLMAEGRRTKPYISPPDSEGAGLW